MAQIPSSAVSSVLTNVQRNAADAARAKSAQSKKNDHHAEDVAEIEENAIASIGEEDSGRSGGGAQQQKKKRLDLKAGGVPDPDQPPTLDLEA